MSKHCPVYGTVLYLDCLECEEQYCKKDKTMKNKIVIGIDQSYKDTGISVAYNGELKSVTECLPKTTMNNSERRTLLRNQLHEIFVKMFMKSQKENAEIVCIIERIRLQSDGFINIDYIKGIGALNAMIVDEAAKFNIPVYSVDTRAWKTSVVGTAKPKQNKYGIDPKKWPTILWCISKGYKDHIINYDVGKRKKGIIENPKTNERYTYNDNKADSICICLYGFKTNQKLKEEH